MLKRIVTLSAVAVCLAAALLVIYNFTTVKHAERAAKFAADAYECSATFEQPDVYAARLRREETRNPVRLLACARMHPNEADGHAAGEARPHTAPDSTDPMPRGETRRERAPRQDMRLAIPPHGCAAALPFPMRLFGEHGFILLFLPLPAPCPPVQPPTDPETPDTDVSEHPAVPDGEQDPSETPEAPPADGGEQPTVVDEAEEPAAE